MTTQPDKLFQHKLNDFQQQAPHAAWERIEAGLDKSNSKPRWIKIAASLVVLAVATFLLWPNESSYSKLSLTGTNDPVKKTDAIKKNTIKLTVPTIGTEKRTEKETKPHDKVYKKNKLSLTANVKEIAIENINAPIEQPEIEAPAVVAVTDIHSAEISPSKTIIYTAGEVNAKFLRKKLPGEATTEEKKSSGIQKLMGYAYTLKNNNNGMGDLRQKKDEILALNFLSQEKTNKSKN